MSVVGVGGIFIRAKDPKALAAWYKEHLSIGGGCAPEGAGEPNEWVWKTLGGPIAFAPFTTDSDYFSPEKAFMLNYRVAGMDALLGRLRAAGIAVETRAEWDNAGLGRFARIHDPEDNPIELWEPAQG